MSAATTITRVGCATPTMSTRDIAELTGKRHDHVLRDTQKMLADLGETSPQFWGDLSDAYGRPQRVAFLPKRETLILVSGYSVTTRAKIIDRWQELESRAAAPPAIAPAAMSRLQLLQLAMQAEQERIDLSEQVQDLAPKAAALDRLATATEGASCLRVTAKLMQVPERAFIEFLNQQGWIFRHRQGTAWLGNADKERAGLLELKRTTVTRDDGTRKVAEQVLVTVRGQAKLAELIERKAPDMRKVAPK